MVQLKKKTTEKLKSFKNYERQSYDEVINQLIQEAEEEPLSDEEIKGIQRGLDDVKAGRTSPIEDVAKRHGIKLRE